VGDEAARSERKYECDRRGEGRRDQRQQCRDVEKLYPKPRRLGPLHREGEQEAEKRTACSDQRREQQAISEGAEIALAVDGRDQRCECEAAIVAQGATNQLCERIQYENCQQQPKSGNHEKADWIACATPPRPCTR
jgi:hypothetical protein